jgi:hypothetical protein
MSSLSCGGAAEFVIMPEKNVALKVRLACELVLHASSDLAPPPNAAQQSFAHRGSQPPAGGSDGLSIPRGDGQDQGRAEGSRPRRQRRLRYLFYLFLNYYSNNHL